MSQTPRLTAAEYGLEADRRYAALEAFRGALGHDAVITGDATREFADPYSPTEWEYLVPPAVLQPATVEEVQAVVRIANEFEVPLWTNSQGRNNGYGGSAPRLPGSFVVNLRRMNRILEVNDELGYVVVEPGVSYNELYEHLRAIGSTLWADVPDLGWGSVVGNALEHGTGYTRFGDHASTICGLEVVLASGEVMRTGLGAMEGNLAWHLVRHGYGPSLEGLFTQSNFGIVTRAGYWCMRQPETYMPCWAILDSNDTVEAFFDALRPLMIDGLVENLGSMFNAAGAIGATGQWTRDEVYTGEGAIPQRLAEEFAKRELGLGAWNMRFAIYGPDAVVQAKFAAVKEALEAVPGVMVAGTPYPGDDLPVDTFDQGQKVMAGIPDMSMLAATKFRRGREGGHLTFSSLVPLTGRDAAQIRDLVRERVEGIGLDYTSTFLIFPRHLVHVAVIVFDLDPDEAARAYDACRNLVSELGELGYSEYRAHVDYMDLVTSLFGYNNHALRRFTETIKDAVDPKGILSPGKQGIWPARIREAALSPWAATSAE